MAGAGGQEVGRISIRAVPDTDGFRKKLQAELEAIEDSLKVTIEANVDLDTAKARAELAKLRAESGKGIKIPTSIDKKVQHLKLDLDPGFDYRLHQKLAKMKAKIKVEPEVDRSALSRLRDVFSKATDNLFGSGGGGFGGGLGFMGRGLAIVAAVAAIAAPALALVSGLLTAMPAVIATLLVPIAAIALGLDGIKEAAKVLAPGLKSLKDVMSAKFEDVFTPIFLKLRDIFPTLEQSLPAVADGLGAMADSFVSVITSGSGLEKIRGIIENISTTFKEMAPGIGSFTSGLLGLANQVTAKFPGVAQWFSKAGDSFSAWVDKVSNDGSLDRAMNHLGDTLKPIMDLGGDLLKQGFDWLQDPKFGATMKGFVEDLKSIINTGVPQLANVFAGVADSIKDIRGAIDEVVAANPFAGEGDRQAARDRIDADKREAKRQQGIGSEADRLNDKLYAQQEAVADTRTEWQKLADAAKQGPDILGAQASKSLDTLMDRGADARAANAQKFWGGLFDDNFDIPVRPEGLLKGINDFMQAPMAKLSELFGIGMAEAAGDAGAQAGPNLGPAIQESIQQQGGIGGGAGLGLLGPQVDQIGPQLQAALAPIQQIPAQIQTAFAGIGAAITGSMANVVSSVVGAGQQIVAAFTAALAQLPGIATSSFSALAGVATGSMAQVVAAIATGGQQAVAAITSMGQQILAAMAAVDLSAAGSNMIQGLINGINSRKAAAVAAAVDVANAVKAATNAALGIHSPSTVFYDIGDNTMQGLLNGIDENGQNVVDKAKALADQIAASMQNGMEGIAPSMKDQLDQTKDQLDLQQKNLQIMSKGTEDKGQKSALQDRIDQISELKSQLDPKSFGTGTMDQLNQTLDQLELQRKALKVDLNAIPKEDKDGRKALQSQIDQLQAQKDQLNLQKDQLAYSKEYGGSLEENDTTMTDTLTSMVNAGKGFAESNIKQFTSDIGISGNGAISQGLEQGIGFGMSMLSKLFSGGGTTINVGSVDDALTAKQTLANKQALQYAGR